MKCAWKYAAALTFVTVSAASIGGCVASELVGAAAGAVDWGADELGTDTGRRYAAREDRLRRISAETLNIGVAEIRDISGREWRGGMLHWVATTRAGQRYRCESGAERAACTPASS